MTHLLIQVLYSKYKGGVIYRTNALITQDSWDTFRHQMLISPPTASCQIHEAIQSLPLGKSIGYLKNFLISLSRTVKSQTQLNVES